MTTATRITDTITQEALHDMFPATATLHTAQDIPPLRVREGEVTRPRMEQRLLQETPRRGDGVLYLEDMIKCYNKLRNDYNNDEADLRGAQLLVTLAFRAQAEEPLKQQLRQLVIDIQYEVNAGDKPCLGRKCVVQGALSEWLKAARGPDQFSAAFKPDAISEGRKSQKGRPGIIL